MDLWIFPTIPTWLILVIGIAFAYYRYHCWHYGIFTRLGIPGPKPIPILGTFLPLIKEGTAKHTQELRKYGTVVGTFQGPTPMLMIYDTDMLKQILISDFNNFTARYSPGSNDYPMSKLLIVVKDDHWRHIRNHLTPSFSSGKLRKMNAKMIHCIETLYKNLEKTIEKKETFEFRIMCGAFTMDVIASTAFGLKIDSHSDPSNQFVKMARKAFDFSFTGLNTILFLFFPYLVKPLSSLGLVSLFPKEAVDFFASAVDRALNERKDVDSDDVDFLQLMANAEVDDEEISKKGKTWTKSRGLSHEEILAQSILFLLAGYDTTANTLALFAYELAVHPEIQDRLTQEIDDVMRDEKQVTYDAVQKMSYLEMCLSEVLRIYPSAPRTDRVTSNEITIKGVRIPKGMAIGVPIYALQNDPEVWPNPEKFDPERFTPAAKEARNPFNYLPFGIGPRNCIGMRLALMELKMAMVCILQRLKFVVCEDTQIPLQLDKLRMVGVNGIKLRVERRQNGLLQ